MCWVIAIVALSPLALCIETPHDGVVLPEVTGQVTLAGRPLNGLTLCLDSEQDGDHTAFCTLGEDGSFRLLNMRYGGFGTHPGRYRAHLNSSWGGPQVPAKFADGKTSGMDIAIAPGWNELNINLKN
jgi:hypothetical protein